MEQQVFSSITKILPKILIAEDDQDLVELLRAIFLNKNYQVDVALNSEDALDLFQRQRYQVVLLDINMPGDTGIQLAERIRNMDKNTQIVIMTAYSDVDYAIQAIQFQVFEYVIKPFKVEDLVSIVDKAFERYQLIKSNQETLQKYLHLVQKFPDGILEFNENGEVLFHNDKAVELAVNGNMPAENGSFKHLKKEIAQALKKACKKTLPQEIYVKFKNTNSEHTVQIVIHAFQDSLNGQNSYIAILKDITQSHLLQKEIIQSEKMASIGQLVTGLAHELKNPLAIISASAQFCLRKLPLNEQVKEHLQVIYRNIENASKIVTQLLNYARPTEMTFHPLDINFVIMNALSLLNSKIDEKDISVNKYLSKKLPSISGDSKALEQVFVNILLNAIEVLPDNGRGRVEIRSYYDKKSKEVVVKVKDNGPGLQEEFLDKIFQPFFTMKLGGTGLGLSICERIIHQHHGKIEAENGENQGMLFIIKFPIVDNEG